MSVGSSINNHVDGQFVLVADGNALDGFAFGVENLTHGEFDIHIGVK